ncbi:MAG: CIA30 family protein, partial [Verrucomicrobiota bacterium]
MKWTILPTILLFSSNSIASTGTEGEPGSTVAEFHSKETAEMGWQIVNDGVMGGLSEGTIRMTDSDSMVFSGNLSLENNGGFSSVRSAEVEMDLSKSKGLKVRVKGDGRTYQLRLASDARFRSGEVSFMAEFATKENEWMEIKIPFRKFEGGWRGMS